MGEAMNHDSWAGIGAYLLIGACFLGVMRFLQWRSQRQKKQQIISLGRAQLCVSCAAISELASRSSEVCPVCKADGTLLSLQRILNPNPTLGAVDFLLSPRFFGKTVSLEEI